MCTLPLYQRFDRFRGLGVPSSLDGRKIGKYNKKEIAVKSSAWNEYRNLAYDSENLRHFNTDYTFYV